MSCTFVLDGERVQCEVTADCRVRGSGFANSICEDNYCVPGPSLQNDDADESEADASALGSPSTCARDSDCTGLDICLEEACVDAFDCEIQAFEAAAMVTMPVTDVFGGALPGTAARLCRSIDPECMIPVAELVTDDQGVLAFELPSGFQGYLEFIVEGYFPQLQFLPPDPPDGAMLQAASLSPTGFIAGLGLQVGAQPDPERGHLFLTLYNCFGPAANIAISSSRSDDESITFYVVDGVPSADLMATAKEGSSGFLNFPTGNAGVTLTHGGTGQELAQLTFVVRAGFLTIARVQPEVQ
jgi:hypothetical protein